MLDSVFCRNMFCVWRSYLEGTVQVTQSRIGSCDSYKVQVSDPAKVVRVQKEQQLRKVRRTSKGQPVLWPGWDPGQILVRSGPWSTTADPGWGSDRNRPGVLLVGGLI